MADSRESSCSTESSLAEQQYEEVQRHQEREKLFHTTNVNHTAAITAMRMESNTRLAQFTVPPTPPTSPSEVMGLLEQFQQRTTNLVEIGKAQLDLSAKMLYNLRLSKHLRNRLDRAGVTVDTHGLVFSNYEEMVKAVARSGCNRALRIFTRQSMTRNKAKASNSQPEQAEPATKERKTQPRKPRAKKVPEGASQHEKAFCELANDLLLTQKK